MPYCYCAMLPRLLGRKRPRIVENALAKELLSTVMRADRHAGTSLDLDIGVIYTYERQLMGPLVASLARCGAGLRKRLILVDNASIDGVAQWREAFATQLELRNARRLTYAQNLNRILHASSAPYILLLNTDMYFDPAEPCLTKMVAFMDAHPACGIATCRLLHADRTEAFAARRLQTPMVILARRLGLSHLLARSIDRYLYRDRSPRDVFECDWISGCFMLVRREAWRMVGDFDIRFQKYFEDVDFCQRIARAGWTVMHNGATYGYHLEQRASGHLLSRDAWRHAVSYARWLVKQRREVRGAQSANSRRRNAA